MKLSGPRWAPIMLLVAACSSFKLSAGNHDGGIVDDNSQADIEAALDANDVQDTRAPDVVDVVVPPDTGVCGTGPGACNVISQAGCGANQACAIEGSANDAGVTTACVQPGGGSYGAACTGPDGCQIGLQCISGQCRKVCCAGSASACTAAGVPAGAQCDQDFGGAVFHVMACRLPCNWTAQDCPSSGTCVPLTAAGISDCFAAGPGTEGSRCTQQTDCGHGLICASSSTRAYCRAVCDPTVRPDPCPGLQLCNALMNSPPTFGVCL